MMLWRWQAGAFRALLVGFRDRRTENGEREKGKGERDRRTENEDQGKGKEKRKKLGG